MLSTSPSLFSESHLSIYLPIYFLLTSFLSKPILDCLDGLEEELFTPHTVLALCTSYNISALTRDQIQ